MNLKFRGTSKKINNYSVCALDAITTAFSEARMEKSKNLW